ncbi:uncharacterized protein LOC128889120 [Hylaeus anthracinus]|uniref:uncharacterized protein LOC128889120 n=1 Tax=Hylaeus anthracinus TaxID=313031 RepID=UPI0023BA094A|nr:uncharacterized protein LOC128889120 [Hylaeus anthracinus]XP_054002485.1 uncharacterized protein LOC128889120 [Hylaeus anthracinus]XP_054002486.1 uncharacterized protein LOC128889120 [Hylaeus anthracinus]XP_054002487.1 uncharacterized protein LOC128889120 [Hylaeus anthracinus]
MAGIFNLFGGISDLDKDPVVKSLSRSKTSLGVHGASIKTPIQPKSKGLSFRSNADSNVPASLNLKSLNKDVFNKQQECLNLKVSQLDSSGISSSPISPQKELPAKKLTCHPDKIKSVSPRNVIFDKNNVQSQKPFDDYVFKEPFLQRNLIMKSYPEPENLAPYCDMQAEFDNIYSVVLENKFSSVFLDKENEDEGFVSEPELLEVELPKLCLSPEFIEEKHMEDWTVDLSKLEDDDDDIF